MRTQKPLQTDLTGTYSFNAAKLELLPVHFAVKPSKTEQLVYSIRLGQKNPKICFVNHKSYSVEQCALHTKAIGMATEYRFRYGGYFYRFEVAVNQTVVQVTKC